MPRYKLHYEDGSDAGEARYAVAIKPGETIVTGDGRKLRVLDVDVDVDAEDEPKFASVLIVAVA